MKSSRSAGEICDVVLVGGGLANSLIALRLRHARPDLRIRMLDAEAAPAPVKTWSVFRSDLSEGAWADLAPTFEASWPAYDVVFPAHSRRLATPYASLRSDLLTTRVQAELGEGAQYGRRVASLAADGVVCEDGLDDC